MINYQREVIWDITLSDVGTDENGLIVSGLKTTAGAPAATAGKFEPGCIIQNIITGVLYVNNGSVSVPVWDILTTAIGNTPLVLDITRITTDTGSFQDVAGDLTYQGNAGGTGAFQAGVMGHFHGNALTNATTYAYHAGVIGGYSVLVSDAVGGPKAGVVGFIGADGPTTIAANAVMAVLEGDGGVVTANAAYGVQYLNSTPGSFFNYGLDLSHVAGGFAAVTFGIADIRLANGITISAGTGAPAASLPKGSLYLRTDGSGVADRMYVATDAVGTWTAVTTVA